MYTHPTHPIPNVHKNVLKVWSSWEIWPVLNSSCSFEKNRLFWCYFIFLGNQLFWCYLNPNWHGRGGGGGKVPPPPIHFLSQLLLCLPYRFEIFPLSVYTYLTPFGKIFSPKMGVNPPNHTHFWGQENFLYFLLKRPPYKTILWKPVPIRVKDINYCGIKECVINVCESMVQKNWFCDINVCEFDIFLKFFGINYCDFPFFCFNFFSKMEIIWVEK